MQVHVKLKLVEQTAIVRQPQQMLLLVLQLQRRAVVVMQRMLAYLNILLLHVLLYKAILKSDVTQDQVLVII